MVLPPHTLQPLFSGPDPRSGTRTDDRWWPARPASVPEVRHWAQTTLSGWQVCQDLCRDVGLLVTELCTNAIRHTGSELIGCALRAGEVLRIEVTDQGNGSQRPQVRTAGPEGERGRGLLLVQMLTSSWGVRPAAQGTGRVVWCEIRPDTDGADGERPKD